MNFPRLPYFENFPAKNDFRACKNLTLLLQPKIETACGRRPKSGEGSISPACSSVDQFRQTLKRVLFCLRCLAARATQSVVVLTVRGHNMRALAI
jgi:hypothetical protein